MKMMRYALLAAILVLLATPAWAADNELPGLWKVVSITDLDTGQQDATRRQHHMFTASHQMIILAGEGRKKIKKSFADMTPAEVASQLPVGAGFYRYRVEGKKLVRTNITALSAYYEGKTFETEYDINGDTLIMRDRHAADGHLREWKLERVE